MEYTHTVEPRGYIAKFQQPDTTQDIFWSQFQPCVWVVFSVMLMFLVLTMAVITAFRDKSRDLFDSQESLQWIFCKFLYILKIPSYLFLNIQIVIAMLICFKKIFVHAYITHLTMYI